MTPPGLLANPGDNILEKYRQLERWIDAQKISSQDELIQLTQTPTGQKAHYVGHKISVVTPLLVSQSGPLGYVVREGYVNGRLPVITPIRGEEQPLVDANGVSHSPASLPGKRPILVVAEVQFSGNFSLQSVKITTKEPSELLRTGVANYVSEGKGVITGHIPLAFNRGNRFIQFVRHNLQVRAYADAGTRRVIYWPA